MIPVILASQSAIRRQLLESAGVTLRCQSAHCDEDVLKAEALAKGISAEDLARHLAEHKALSIPDRDTLVIGADQTLACEGQLLNKAKDIADARAKLLQLRGRTHHLHSGVALVKNGACVWSMVSTVALDMRAFSDAALDTYLAQAGDALTRSVGAYEFEGLGASLFEQVTGDYHAILGLPLLPTLAALRAHGGMMS